MRSFSTTLAIAFCACALAVAPADGQEEAARRAAQQQEEPQAEAPPRYTPFPHNLIFNLVDIDGKTPPKEMWLRVDSTGRANGSSGCKNWSGIFAVGPDRFGPRSHADLHRIGLRPGAKGL